MGGGRFPGRESQQNSLQDRKSMDFGSVDSRRKICLSDGRTGSQVEAVRDSEMARPTQNSACCKKTWRGRPVGLLGVLCETPSPKTETRRSRAWDVSVEIAVTNMDQSESILDKQSFVILEIEMSVLNIVWRKEVLCW